MCCHATTTPSIFAWEGGHEHHVAAYPKLLVPPIGGKQSVITGLMRVIVPFASHFPAGRWVKPVLLLVFVSLNVGKHCLHSSCILGVICRAVAVMWLVAVAP